MKTYRTIVRNNIVINAIGAFQGAESYYYEAYGKAAGIYLDGSSNHVEISGNTVAHGEWCGIFVNNNSDNQIKNNLVYNFAQQLLLSEFAVGGIRNLTVTGNLFVARTSSQKTMYLKMYANDNPGFFGTFDNNCYARPINDNTTITVDREYNGGDGIVNYTLIRWQAISGKDDKSYKSPISIASYQDDNIIFEFNSTNVNKTLTLEGEYLDSKNNIYSNQVLLEPYTSIILLKKSSTISPSVCSGMGSILREQWNNISGWAITSIPLQSAPGSSSQLSSFESRDVGQFYGARIRGYICPPKNGNYTFWIAGDDVLELWLSTDDNPANKFKICYTNYTVFREWNKYPSQKSALVNLQSGKRYYIEVLQKEGGGGGHSSVAWTLPNGAFQAPIPGSHLSTYIPQNITSQAVNFAPLSIKTFGDPPFTISATASSGLPVSFRIVSGPATLSGNALTLTSTGTVSIEAFQTGNAAYTPAPPVIRSFTVSSASSVCSGTGSILREQWNNISGWAITSIPLQSAPGSSSQLYSLESQDVGQLYGARIRGYICPPQNGNYTFWIAGDDVLELWLSTDDNPANKFKICYTNYTVFREWNKYPSQKSVPVNLQSGKRYYIEVLQKEGGGGGHSSVAWTLPNGAFQAPIPGNLLSTYAPQNVTAEVQNILITETTVPNEVYINAKLSTYPNPFKNAATIEFNCLQSGHVTLDIFDKNGKLIKHLYNGNVKANVLKNIILNAEGLNNGIYILRLITNNTVKNHKITLNN